MYHRVYSQRSYNSLNAFLQTSHLYGFSPVVEWDRNWEFRKNSLLHILQLKRFIPVCVWSHAFSNCYSFQTCSRNVHIQNVSYQSFYWNPLSYLKSSNAKIWLKNLNEITKLKRIIQYVFESRDFEWNPIMTNKITLFLRNQSEYR